MVSDQVAGRRTANERFKERFGATLWASVIAAVVAHALAIALFPAMSVADVRYDAVPLTAVELPEEIPFPPPPEQIARPAAPVAADVDIDVTIEPTTLDTRPEDRPLPPPPVTRRDEASPDVPTFTPVSVLPELANRAEIQRELERRYPRLLRETGVSGSPEVWFYIDEEGRVVKTQLNVSSGYAGLDDAALQVADKMRFRPARDRGRTVAVWVSLPIHFTAK